MGFSGGPRRLRGQAGASRPEPPDDAAGYLVTHRRVTVSRNRLEELGLEVPEDSEGDSRIYSDAKTVTYKKGEELPAAVGDDIYPSFHDRLSPVDEAGNRIE